MSQRRYLSCTETAKLVRQVLKESFPGQTFSVRSSQYAGGASIRIRWQDGPAAKTVDSCVGVFEGSYFDGMTDYKGSQYATLDGQPVRFFSDFVSTERTLSKSAAEHKVAYFAAKYGRTDWVTLSGSDEFGYRVSVERDAPSLSQAMDEYDKAHTPQPSESHTRARIKLTGDDRRPNSADAAAGMPPGGPDAKIPGNGDTSGAEPVQS